MQSHEVEIALEANRSTSAFLSFLAEEPVRIKTIFHLKLSIILCVSGICNNNQVLLREFNDTSGLHNQIVLIYLFQI